MSSNIAWHNATVTRARREKLNGHRGAAIWFTGFSGAGKSTIAHSVEEHLHQAGCRTIVLDGDNVRHGLCSDLGFSAPDRTENIRRISETVKLFVEAGIIVLTAFISPQRADRLRARETLGVTDFIEVYCRCSLAECERRDVKGLYKRARAGEIKDFTGISAPYDEPEHPEVILDTQTLPVEQCVEHVLQSLILRGVFPLDQISLLQSRG